MLVIESDVCLSVFPSIQLCLIDLQFLPNGVYKVFEAIADNIDAWRVSLVGKIKQYASTISVSSINPYNPMQCRLC